MMISAGVLILVISACGGLFTSTYGHINYAQEWLIVFCLTFFYIILAGIDQEK